MAYLTYLIPVLALAGLCAGWVGVQLLARKLKTKNHIDNSSSTCGTCSCGGIEECDNEDEPGNR